MCLPHGKDHLEGLKNFEITTYPEITEGRFFWGEDVGTDGE